MTGKVLLLVEDTKEVSSFLLKALQKEESAVDVAVTLAEALIAIKKRKYDAIICDVNLPDSKGMKTVETLVAATPFTPVIIISGTDDRCELDGIRKGAHDNLDRGDFTIKELVRCVRNAIERHKVRQLFKPLEQELSDVQVLVDQMTKGTP